MEVNLNLPTFSCVFSGYREGTLAYNELKVSEGPKQQFFNVALIDVERASLQ